MKKIHKLQLRVDPDMLSAVEQHTLELAEQSGLEPDLSFGARDLVRIGLEGASKATAYKSAFFEGAMQVYAAFVLVLGATKNAIERGVDPDAIAEAINAMGEEPASRASKKE